MTIEQQLARLLKNWENQDQAWWINAMEYSIKQCGKASLMSWVTTTGKDEPIVAGA
jgi:hypothetical protein